MAIEPTMPVPQGIYVDERDLSDYRLSSGAQGGAGDFVNWLNREIESVDRQIGDAEVQVRGMALGERDNLHQVMLSLEKAKLGFELVVQVRNKLLEGYQDIMRMQV